MSQNTFSERPYQVTFPGDDSPDVHRDERSIASAANILTNSPHIHSHPNLKKAINESMAIKQGNVPNQILVSKEEQA